MNQIRILRHSHVYHRTKSAQKWNDVQALELPEADRAVLRGRRPEEASLLLSITKRASSPSVRGFCFKI